MLPLLAAVACGGDPIRRNAERVMQRTTPAGVVGPYLSFARSPAGVDAEWSFQLTISWAAYSSWVVDRLAPDYSCKADAAAVHCTQVLEGDIYRVTLTSPDGTSVRVVFTARPG